MPGLASNACRSRRAAASGIVEVESARTQTTRGVGDGGNWNVIGNGRRSERMAFGWTWSAAGSGGGGPATEIGDSAPAAGEDFSAERPGLGGLL